MGGGGQIFGGKTKPHPGKGNRAIKWRISCELSQGGGSEEGPTGAACVRVSHNVMHGFCRRCVCAYIRENHIQKKIKMQLLDAKAKSSAKDKRGALFALKRKKMYEGEVNKLNGARMTLESQVLVQLLPIVHRFMFVYPLLSRMPVLCGTFSCSGCHAA